MTYLELANHILKNFTKEQQNSDITIYDEFEDEYFPSYIDYAKETDILDKDHPFISILKD